MKNINKLLAGYHDFTLKTQKKSQLYHIPFKKVGTLFLTLQKFVVSLKKQDIIARSPKIVRFIDPR